MNEVVTKVGMIGCGNISSIYFKVAQQLAPIEIVACADINMSAAKERAAEFNVPSVYTVSELLADPDIEIVLNLTTPDAHASVALAALEAGKSVYNEKPLTLTRAEGQQMLALAAEKGLLVGCAPDTFLGGGIQTCCKLIDDGAIGRPLSATAFMMSGGHEGWHPNPDFYYQVGGGPMFDMGPYYLTTLVALLGPVASVSGVTSMGWEQRVIGSEPKRGQIIDVEVPTHVMGLMRFASGAVGSIITSFDMPGGSQSRNIEIHGSEGTLLVPDPNTFGGPVYLRQRGEREWREIALTHGHAENSRGLGVANMALALQTGDHSQHRASGELAYHVLDLMHAFHDASAQGQQVVLESSYERPLPL
ncbi:MAG: Gfo/Idh/MocA family oxidoreductase [Chloroflexota bacterium]